MGGRLITATEHRCAGQERDGEELVQIETDRKTASHDIGVQHFQDGTTDVLCGNFRSDVCNLIFRDKGGGKLKRIKGGTGNCPFKKG